MCIQSAYILEVSEGFLYLGSDRTSPTGGVAVQVGSRAVKSSSHVICTRDFDHHDRNILFICDIYQVKHLICPVLYAQKTLGLI